MTVAASWDDLASEIELTGDARHRHIPGSPMEYEHDYVPLTEAAARSHFKGSVPKSWHAPAGGAKGGTERPAVMKAGSELKPGDHVPAMPGTGVVASTSHVAPSARAGGRTRVKFTDGRAASVRDGMRVRVHPAGGGNATVPARPRGAAKAEAAAKPEAAKPADGLEVAKVGKSWHVRENGKPLESFGTRKAAQAKVDGMRAQRARFAQAEKDDRQRTSALLASRGLRPVDYRKLKPGDQFTDHPGGKLRTVTDAKHFGNGASLVTWEKDAYTPQGQNLILMTPQHGSAYGPAGKAAKVREAVAAEARRQGIAPPAKSAPAAKPGSAERPNTIVQPDPVTGNLREMTQKETAEAASRYAQTLRPGSAERGEVERQALDIARGGPTWQRMKEGADALRPLLGTHGGGPKPEKDLSFFEVQDAYQAAHGRPAPKSMLTSWAFNGPSGQDKRSDWYQAGVKRKGETRAQMSLRADLLGARPDEVKAKEDAAQANALADIRAVQQAGQRAAQARVAATPKAPRPARAPAPKRSAGEKLALISERMSGGDRTSGDMQAGDMLQGHQAISQAPAGIIGGVSDPWWMAGPHGSFALSVKGGDGKRQLIPWGAEKQAEAEAAAVKASGQVNRYGASYGSGFQRTLAKAVASRQHYEQLGFARTWDDLASVIELAVSAPARPAGPQAVKSPPPAARKAPPGRPPGKPAGAVSPGRGSQGAASSTVPDPNGNPPVSRRRGVTPLTPMRRDTAKSMRKLAQDLQAAQPDMTTHAHMRLAARQVEKGNEDGAIRHLQAAMRSLSGSSLQKHGIHVDDAHIAARKAMQSAVLHYHMVKDIQDAAARNREAITRLGTEDDTALRPADPNAGYGPGANAQKPTARQPPGNQALNAPNRGSSGGSDPAVADPNGPQPRGSKQFAYGWGELAVLLAAGDDCYRCSTPNAPDARYCKRCGNPMEPRQPYDRFAAEDVTCPFCGRGDEKDATYCDQCGKRLPEGPVAAFANGTRAVDLSARTAMLERTPAPRGKPGGPGLYGVAGQEHTHYLQQVVKALIEKRGMPPSKAYAIAYGALRKWARGGGKVHGEVRAAAAGALAGEAAKVHGHAVTWGDLAGVIDLSFNPDQARVAAGSATAGQFAPANGSAPPPAAQQPAGGKQPAKAPAQTPAQKAAAAHAAHVAHVAHLNGVSTAKAELLVTAQDDQQKADALIKQRDALTAALASAGGKTSKGQAGAKTASTAKTKSTAPAKSGTAAGGTAKAGTTAASTSKAGTATAKTTAAKTATSAKSAATAVAAAAGSTAAIKAQIAQLNIQIGALLAAAAQATAQAAAMK